MKKIAIFALVMFLIIASVFGFYLYSLSKEPSIADSINESAMQKKILNNSSWIYLEKKDFNGYLNGTYTPSVQSIILSLEEAIPVIFQTSNDKFGNFEEGTFIVASAFNAQNDVYVYYYNESTNKYIKNISSLESLLENANAVYIYNDEEVL